MSETIKKAQSKKAKNKPKGPILNTVENQRYEVSEELSRLDKKKHDKA